MITKTNGNNIMTVWLRAKKTCVPAMVNYGIKHTSTWQGGQAIQDLCTGPCWKIRKRRHMQTGIKPQVLSANYSKKQNQCKKRIFIGLVTGKNTCLPAIARILWNQRTVQHGVAGRLLKTWVPVSVTKLIMESSILGTGKSTVNVANDGLKYTVPVTWRGGQALGPVSRQ